MQIDFGTLIAVAAALIFYLRLIILQRHRAKQTQIHTHKQTTSSKTGDIRGYTPPLGLQIVSWYLLGMGAVLILLGALMTAFPIFGQPASELWWLVLTVGILLLGLSIR